MKNKLIFTTIFYIIGITLAYSEIIAVGTLIISGIIAILALYISFDKISNLIYYIIIICLSIIIGFLFTKNNLNNQTQNFYNSFIKVEGTVTEKNIENDAVVVRINNIYYEGKETGNLREKIVVNLEDKTDVNTGSIIEIESRLLEPISSTNRYIFDYNKYLQSKKITGNMFSNTDHIKIIKEEGLIYKLRKTLVNKILELIDLSTNDMNSRILKSVVFGNDEYLDDEFLQDIRRTGIAHIFAVSGLHIGILIVVFTFIFKFLKFNVNRCKIYILILLWVYGFVIAFPISILRALIIYSIIVIGQVLYRKNSPFNSISLAALILLIYNPLWLYDVGFQLSFTTTFVIYLYIYFISPKIKNKYINRLLLIPFIQIGIIPILAYYFNYISIFSFAGNLFLVPFFSLILSICFAGILLSFVFFPIGGLLLQITNLMLSMFNFILEFIFDIPVLGFRIYTPQLDFIFVYYSVFLFIVYIIHKKNNIRINKFIYICIICFFIIHIFIPINFNNSLEVSFLDVGQGNASILTYKDTNIMIDSGGDIYSNYNKGKEEIPDYLIKKGIFKIDLAFISHFHEDHYCSYEDIQDEAYVEKFFSYRKNDQISYINNEKIIPLDSSKSIMIDDNFKINIIWPDVGDYYQDENDNSLVLLINFYDTKILYTGDISKRVEENLIDRIKDEIDIILVPHHGSNTSSSKKFVEKIKPQNAVFSYGRNFYGIPSTKVVELYKNNSSKIYSTFKDGEIWSIINKDGKYKIWAYNENNKNEVSLLNILMVEMFLFLILNYAHERDLYNEKNRKI